MGMSIDEIKTKLDKCNIDSNTLIELTRYLERYQKIKNIISKWEVGIYDDEGLCDVEVLEMISMIIDEVVEDGNVD